MLSVVGMDWSNERAGHKVSSAGGSETASTGDSSGFARVTCDDETDRPFGRKEQHPHEARSQLGSHPNLVGIRGSCTINNDCLISMENVIPSVSADPAQSNLSSSSSSSPPPSGSADSCNNRHDHLGAACVSLGCLDARSRPEAKTIVEELTTRRLGGTTTAAAFCIVAGEGGPVGTGSSKPENPSAAGDLTGLRDPLGDVRCLQDKVRGAHALVAAAAARSLEPRVADTWEEEELEVTEPPEDSPDDQATRSAKAARCESSPAGTSSELVPDSRIMHLFAILAPTIGPFLVLDDLARVSIAKWSLAAVLGRSVRKLRIDYALVSGGRIGTRHALNLCTNVKALDVESESMLGVLPRPVLELNLRDNLDFLRVRLCDGIRDASQQSCSESVFASNPGLRILDLSGGSARMLLGLQRLEVVRLAYVSFEPGQLKALRGQLRILDLYHCKGLRDADIVAVSSTIVEFHLAFFDATETRDSSAKGANTITDAIFDDDDAAWPLLEILELTNVALFSDAGVEKILLGKARHEGRTSECCPRLKALTLSCPSLTDRSLSALAAGTKKLERLVLDRLAASKSRRKVSPSVFAAVIEATAATAKEITVYGPPVLESSTGEPMPPLVSNTNFSLQKVHLHCFDLPAESLGEIIRASPDLRKLHFSIASLLVPPGESFALQLLKVARALNGWRNPHSAYFSFREDLPSLKEQLGRSRVAKIQLKRKPKLAPHYDEYDAALADLMARTPSSSAGLERVLSHALAADLDAFRRPEKPGANSECDLYQSLFPPLVTATA